MLKFYTPLYEKGVSSYPDTFLKVYKLSLFDN